MILKKNKCVIVRMIVRRRPYTDISIRLYEFQEVCNYSGQCQFNAGARRWPNINPLTAKLFNWNFHPLEVVSR